MDPAWNIKFMVAAPGGIRTNFGSNVQVGARHPAYDTPDSLFNRTIKYMMDPAMQERFSTPEKCAEVLFNVVVGQDQRALPTRLLMGGETIPMFEAEYKRISEEMEAWKKETVQCSPKGGLQGIPDL